MLVLSCRKREQVFFTRATWFQVSSSGQIVFVEEWFERQSYDKAYNTLRGHTDFGGEISGNKSDKYASDGDSSQRRHYKKIYDSSAHPRVGCHLQHGIADWHYRHYTEAA